LSLGGIQSIKSLNQKGDKFSRWGRNDMKHGGDYVSYQNKYGKLPIDYSENTSPFGIPEAVKRAIIESLSDAAKYPDPDCRSLRDKLSRHHKVPIESIICGNGAADIIFRLALAVKPKKALVTAPTFSEYQAALDLVNCQTDTFQLDPQKDFLIDEGLLDQIDQNLDILYLCQPNNPTGKTCPGKLMQAIFEKCKAEKVLLVVDECFLDFVENGETKSLIKATKATEQLIVLKAFTKLYAMAGVRLGYAISGNQPLITRMKNCGQPWNVSTMAQAAGLAALDQTAYVQKVLENTQMERAYFFGQFQRLGIPFVPSEANYILFYSDVPAFDQQLAEKGFLIRNCSNYKGLDDAWYRIAVKAHQNNEQLIKAMEDILNGM